MTSPRFEDPQLYIRKSGEISLSGRALLELMRTILGRGFRFRFRARGWSMAPFIKDGDVITIAPLKNTLPGIGAVVAFVRPKEDKLVVHRIIAKRSKNAIIQGDNGLDYPEEIIPQENLLGRVLRIERDGHDVWIGLGLERYMIAWLSRARLLGPLGTWLSLVLRQISRRNK